MKGLLEIVSSSAEFETVPIRRHEEQALRRIYDRVPVKVDKPDYEAPHFKTFVLLQAHFSRIHLPPDLQSDLNLILEKILNLLSAAVDVMSSNAWLSALGAMDLSQMCVQACWETDSHLKQIPHFESDVIKRCLDAGVETVYDVMELDEAKGRSLLQMDDQQFKDVDAFLKSYPTLELNFELVKDEYKSGAPIQLRVFLNADAEDDDEDAGDQVVVAPFYPPSKMVHWWVVVGEPSTRQLLAIKRVTVKKSLTVNLEFTLSQGTHDVKLYLICDSYLGVDHELKVDPIEVAEGEESDSDEDMDSGEESG